MASRPDDFAFGWQAPGAELWRPNARLDVLRARAVILARIRAFFDRRGVLEVETPILAAAGATDLHLDSLTTALSAPGMPGERRLYLQTSPEFAMKRLLAAGSGPIYQIGKVFRDGEAGRAHNPEFTMLEWYRPGFDQHAMMDEVEALTGGVLGSEPADRVSYAMLFEDRLGIDPHRAPVRELRACARRHGLNANLPLDEGETWLDLLMSHLIEPGLGAERPAFVYDYPVSHAALARVRRQNPPVAERFELYIGGVEIANGFHELTDAREQRTRFERDRQRRRLAGRADMIPDERLLAALEQGLPPCAGVALGVDRLVMLAVGASSVEEVMAFNIDRA